MLLALPAQAQFLAGTVPVGSGPTAIGINSVTNKAYVANAADGTLTIIDGSTQTTATLAVGANPQAVLVNAATNKIYVAKPNSSGTVTIVDGATHQTTTVIVGGFPSASLHAATNLVYVANQTASGTLTVIDGSKRFGRGHGWRGRISQRRCGGRLDQPDYVANSGADSVTVVNGADNSTSSISTGAGSNPVGGRRELRHRQGLRGLPRQRQRRGDR